MIDPERRMILLRFEKEKKDAIMRYLLKKLDEGVPNAAKVVSDAFGINQNTVHTYINELLRQGTIERVKRGVYRLTEQSADYSLSRQKGEIRDEQVIYETRLSQHLKTLPKNVREIWEYILGEMINNVIDHSGAENMLIRVRQTALSTRIIIADNGIGIFAKIKDHFGMNTLDEAICELFKGKLTTDPENHSGEGIFFSSRLADRFVILSDQKYFSINKYDNDALLDVPVDAGGTVVLIELSNASNKTAAGIFDQYAQVDGGFQTTVIPLKNMFDSAPVSRSQAKRVCQRLDKFKEVVLDFDGLEWMGQGFAHQLFIVFQKKHPGVALTPVHMNRSVEQMYLHVTGRDYR